MAFSEKRRLDPIEEELEAAITEACWRGDDDAAYEFSLAYGEYQRFYKIPSPDTYENRLLLDCEGGTTSLRLRRPPAPARYHGRHAP